MAFAASAPAEITGTGSADRLAEAITAAPVSGAELVAPPRDPEFDPYPNGVADAPLAGFPTAGAGFAILTTGDASFADDANESASSGAGFNDPDPPLPFGGEAHDLSRLAIPITVPADRNCLAFDYKFASEEFPEFIGSPYNDGFIAELDSSTFLVDTASNVTAPNDFAGPIGQGRVTINNVGPTLATPEQAVGTTYDAASAAVATKHVVTPGDHTLYLSVFDVGDKAYDTAVFIDNLQLTTESPQTCRPPDTYGGRTGIAVTKAKAKDKRKRSAKLKIACLAPVACTGTVDVTAKVKKKWKGARRTEAHSASSARALARAKRGRLGAASYVIAPATTQGVKLKLTKKGRKLIKQARKLRLTIAATNPANGAIESLKKNAKVKRKKRKRR